MTALHAAGGGLPLALHIPHVVEQAGSIAGFASVIGLAILSALYFSQARDLRRLREWAGRAPERAAEAQPAGPVPGRVVAQPQRPPQPGPQPGTQVPAATAPPQATPAPAATPAPGTPAPGATPAPATPAGAAPANGEAKPGEDGEAKKDEAAAAATTNGDA